ncbi:MAG: MBL fold metallo-hydrolase [Gammaproteobacteria bacterium]|nr:MBL fold metallo-hydrolase [Gammaproteobacteria bacterium]
MLFGNIAEVDESNRGFNGNAGFVVTDAGVIAIDSLGSPELGRRMIATIRSVTDKPIKYLILTHSHPDHSYGAVAFRRLGGVTVVGHEGTLDYIHSERIDGSAEYRRGFIAEDMQGFEGVEPDVLIGGERFSKRSIHLGDRRLEVYNVGQHHSAGDLVVRQVEARILWIGDLAFNGRVTFMADGHSKQILEGQRWLMESFGERARLMVPGHGSAQTPPFPMVERTRRYVTGLRRKMARAVEQGWGLQKAVERSHMPAWEEVRLYGLNHRPNANFVYREMEMALF